jgi:mono/diheme cytochrome c family protein
MFRRRLLCVATGMIVCSLPVVLHAQDTPHVAAATPEAAGQYLLIVGSCHDCHTPRWTETKGKVPVDDYMTGTSVGYKGPWGTVYAKNLRTIAARQSEDHWVEVLKTTDGGDGNLPMPWHNTAQMNEDDLRAMYKYVKSLGSKVGERIPRNVKPGVEPASAYIDLSVKPAADTAKKPPK